MKEQDISRRSFVIGAAVLGSAGIASLAGCSSGQGDASADESKEAVVTPDASYDTDLLIIGCGGSGLACAVQAMEDGTSCIILETAGKSGGNAVGVEGMFAINSSMQKAAGIAEITPAEVISGQMKNLQYRPSGADWVEFCEGSADNIDWCLEQGVEYSGVIDNYYTGDLYTFHWFKGGCKEGYIPQMTARLEKMGADIRYSTKATGLIRDGKGAVVGAYAEGDEGTIQFNAKAVVLATGGFCSNPDIIKLQGWDTTDLVCMGGSGTGDGYTMALAIGAADDISNSAQSIAPSIAALPVCDYMKDPMNPVNGLQGIPQCGPTILIDQNCDRFVREDVGTQMPGSSSLLSTKRNQATYCVFDQSIYEARIGLTDDNRKMFEDALNGDGGKSLASADTIEGLAKAFDLDADNLTATIKRYNESCAAGVDKDFLKDPSALMPIEKAPFYIARLSFQYYFATGGLFVDKQQQVWDTEKMPIPGLYACGNDGNNHYASVYTINIPGTAFGHQVNSGRKAAANARTYIDTL